MNFAIIDALATHANTTSVILAGKIAKYFELELLASKYNLESACAASLKVRNFVLSEESHECDI